MSALRSFPITRVDAFADRAFTGNPAAVMPLEEWLSDDLLQSIAAENNLSETAFLVPDQSGEADYELRWFTPTVEVALCGHATLASGHVLLTAAQWRNEMRFRTRKAGILQVSRDGDGDAYSDDPPRLLAPPRNRCPRQRPRSAATPSKHCGTTAAIRWSPIAMRRASAR